MQVQLSRGSSAVASQPIIRLSRMQHVALESWIFIKTFNFACQLERYLRHTFRCRRCPPSFPFTVHPDCLEMCETFDKAGCIAENQHTLPSAGLAASGSIGFPIRRQKVPRHVNNSASYMNSLSLIATRGKNELKARDLAPSKAQVSIHKAKLVFSFCPTSCRGPYKDSLHWTGINVADLWRARLETRVLHKTRLTLVLRVFQMIRGSIKLS
jgi:hypothetical protein